MNAAVFAISPDSLFQIQPYALSAIAASSIASGLGIAVDAWFLFRYNWIDLKTFIVSLQYNVFIPLATHIPLHRFVLVMCMTRISSSHYPLECLRCACCFLQWP